MRETKYALVLASAALACNSAVVLDGGGPGTSTSTGTTTGAGGAGPSSSSNGGQADGGGFVVGGMGGTPMTPWENHCTDDTFFDVEMDGAASVSLLEACPYSWAEQFHDGPDAHEIAGGANLLPSLHWQGCGPGGSPSLSFGTSSAMAGAAQMDGGLYQNDGGQWDVVGGSMTLTLEEDVGGMVEGDYVATFGDANGPVAVHGAFRVCHVPLEALP